MSKSLYINFNRVLLADDTYFPFTHTISDLETVNIIGVPSSKTVSIPRCPQNDEIFGYVADITRVNYVYSNDNYIGVSFNQTKKCTYHLYNDSEIVSEGLLSLDNVTETSYEVTLYDELIQKLELLNGDPETGDYYLSSCGLISGSNYATMSMASTSTNIYSCNNTSSYVKPVVCIKDSDLDKTTIRALTLPGNIYANVTLPTECTSLQLRTLKNYEVNYATSIKNVIDSVNLKYPTTLETSSLLDGLFSEVQVLCKSPTNIESQTNYCLTSSIAYDNTLYSRLQDSGSVDICNFNGKKYFKLDIEFKYTTIDPTGMIGCNKVSGSIAFNETFYGGSPTGTVFSKQWAKVWFENSGSSSIPVYYELDCVVGENSVFHNGGGGWDYVVVTDTIYVECDLYPKLSNSTQPTYIHCDLQNYDPNDPTILWYLLTYDTSKVVDYQKILNTSTLTESTTTFRTNDTVRGENILPKISIKSFIVQLAKFFNLDIVNSGTKLKLQPKTYYLSPENLLVDSISSMNPKNITFSKLVLTTKLPKSTTLDTYKKYNKKTYGEQVITTGYTIKNVDKKVEMETAVPLLLKDYNSFAYDRFGKYVNGGYARNNTGVVTDIDSDNLTLGYINVVPEKIYITDDSPFEAGMNTTLITGSVETKFVHYNPKLVVNTALSDTNISKYQFTSSADPSYGVRTLTNYMTFSPYKFTGTTVSASLDMNKPVTNYANMTDADYSTDTTLYHRFHRNMIVDKYSSNTHILTARIYIDGKLDIYNIYNYHNTNYIISKIVEYDPTIPGVYEVELMRVNDTSNYTTNIIL